MGKRRKIIQAGVLAAVLLLCAGCSQEEMQKMNPLAMAAGTVTSAMGGSKSGGFTSLFSNDKMVHTEWVDIREDIMTGRSGVKGVKPITAPCYQDYLDIKLGDTIEDADRKIKRTLDGNMRYEGESHLLAPVIERTYGHDKGVRANAKLRYRGEKVTGKSFPSQFELTHRIYSDMEFIDRQSFDLIHEGDDYKDVTKTLGVDGFPGSVSIHFPKKGKQGDGRFHAQSNMIWLHRDSSGQLNGFMEAAFDENGKMIGKTWGDGRVADQNSYVIYWKK